LVENARILTPPSCLATSKCAYWSGTVGLPLPALRGEPARRAAQPGHVLLGRAQAWIAGLPPSGACSRRLDASGVSTAGEVRVEAVPHSSAPRARAKPAGRSARQASDQRECWSRCWGPGSRLPPWEATGSPAPDSVRAHKGLFGLSSRPPRPASPRARRTEPGAAPARLPATRTRACRRGSLARGPRAARGWVGCWPRGRSSRGRRASPRWAPGCPNSVTGGCSAPPCVNRSPQSSVRVVSSKR
jgi:hypothetical protein